MSDLRRNGINKIYTFKILAFFVVLLGTISTKLPFVPVNRKSLV